MVLRPLKVKAFLGAGMCRSCKLWARNALECWKKSLKGHYNGGSEDKKVKRDVDGDLAPERSEDTRTLSGTGLMLLLLLKITRSNF